MGLFNPFVSNIGGGGRVQEIDYNPGNTNVSAGSVVVIDEIACFAQSDIAANALGALAFAGGVWAGNKDSTTWSNGQRIYYNPTGTPNVGTAGTGAFTNTPGSSNAGTGTAYIFVGYAVLSPSTGVAAASGDQLGYFVKVNGTGSDLRAISGQWTTVTASDTVVTPLNTVVAVIANLDSAPVLTCDRATASIGNQSSAPAAGSILIDTWMPTSNSNPTPIAATTFTKKVNYVAYGY